MGTMGEEVMPHLIPGAHGRAHMLLLVICPKQEAGKAFCTEAERAGEQPMQARTKVTPFCDRISHFRTQGPGVYSVLSE